jgi:hypothetical protein
VTDAADFIDAGLQYEVSPYVWPSEHPDGLQHYGTSVGAIRGTVNNALRRYPGMTHDELTRLSSELWAVPVFERRAAAIILLQGHVQLLVTNDLTRFEGFIRSAGSSELVDQLVSEILEPMSEQLAERMDATARSKALVVFARWRNEEDAALRSAGERLVEKAS